MFKKEVKEVIVFFTAVIGLSYLVFWGPIALLKVPTVNLVDGEMGPIWAIVLFIIGGFVPSIVGIMLTAKYEGREGVKKLFKQSIKVKIGYKAFIAIIIIAVYFAVSLILTAKLTNSDFNYSQFWIQLPTIIPLIILGPLSEEYGWRGFAIKRLLKCTNANLASLIIGIVWALWHLPLFYMLGSSQYEMNMPFLVFLVSVVGTSFIYTYFYTRTKASIFSAILLHWLYTYVMQVVSSSITRTGLFNWLEVIPTVVIGLIFAIIMRNDKTFDLSKKEDENTVKDDSGIRNQSL